MFEVDGSRDNNVIQANVRWFAHNFSPFLDRRPQVEKDKRFKALAGVVRRRFASDGKRPRAIGPSKDLTS